VLVPGEFNVTPAPDGGWLIYAEGDACVPSSAWMPKDAFFRRDQPPATARRIKI
jgi:hypothetical protein